MRLLCQLLHISICGACVCSCVRPAFVTHQSLDSHHTALISYRKYRSSLCFCPVSLLCERQTPPSGTKLSSSFLDRCSIMLKTEIYMVFYGVLSGFSTLLCGCYSRLLNTGSTKSKKPQNNCYSGSWIRTLCVFFFFLPYISLICVCVYIYIILMYMISVIISVIIYQYQLEYCNMLCQM